MSITTSYPGTAFICGTMVVLSTSSLVYNLFVHWNLPCQNNAGDKNQLSGREATFLNTNQPHRSQPKPPTPAALRTEP